MSKTAQVLIGLLVAAIIGVSVLLAILALTPWFHWPSEPASCSWLVTDARGVEWKVTGPCL